MQKKKVVTLAARTRGWTSSGSKILNPDYHMELKELPISGAPRQTVQHLPSNAVETLHKYTPHDSFFCKKKAPVHGQ